MVVIAGRSMLGFSLTSPDLVVCAGSPDIPQQNSVETERAAAIVLSLEEGINGVEAEASRSSQESSKFSSFWHPAEVNISLIDYTITPQY